ncbi:MAG: hypothetical protein HYU78_02045 [Rhodocyclales bacterium]|nr:hypothetical protein [Rhodocyclales bacterium]
MVKGNLVAGLLALAFFSYAQYAGWNLFDKEASAQGARSSGSRLYHK